MLGMLLQPQVVEAADQADLPRGGVRPRETGPCVNVVERDRQRSISGAASGVADLYEPAPDVEQRVRDFVIRFFNLQPLATLCRRKGKMVADGAAMFVGGGPVEIEPDRRSRKQLLR